MYTKAVQLYHDEKQYWESLGKKRNTISKAQSKAVLAFLAYFDRYINVEVYCFPQLLTPEHDEYIKKWLTNLENDPDLSEDEPDSSNNEDMIEDGELGIVIALPNKGTRMLWRAKKYLTIQSDPQDAGNELELPAECSSHQNHKTIAYFNGANMQALDNNEQANLVTALMEWQVAEDAIACALKNVTAILPGMKGQMVQRIQEGLP
ncbi:hypothetical protein L208DRAFT_1375930 [Tricholoma matsutake]|nr:hypothetical protein L208DRAFT_1375930 [Tricholoma matsutake 945]